MELHKEGNNSSKREGRRDFMQKLSLGSLALTVSSGLRGSSGNSSQVKQEPSVSADASSLPNGGKPIKWMEADLNWVHSKEPHSGGASAPQDWAFISPDEFFQWHKDFGNNIIHVLAYTSSGYAFYPSKLGALAPGPGSELLPKVFRLAQKAGLPFMSYFCVGADFIMSSLRGQWVVPTSRHHGGEGFLAPESPWTDLLCARVEEFLRLYPVDWLLFDWFVYGNLWPNEFPVQPAWFVKEPFKEIIGRAMPDEAYKIYPEESLKYKREILARQFYRIREAVHKGNRETKIAFNVPYRRPAEPLWVNHPMLNETDMLFAESSDEIVDWLLEIRKPHQRVMTTILGRPRDIGVCDPNTWRKWYGRGCDLYGELSGTPPDFRPNQDLDQLEIVRQAFKEIPS